MSNNRCCQVEPKIQASRGALVTPKSFSAQERVATVRSRPGAAKADRPSTPNSPDTQHHLHQTTGMNHSAVHKQVWLFVPVP